VSWLELSYSSSGMLPSIGGDDARHLKKVAYVACHGVFDFLIKWRKACLGVT